MELKTQMAMNLEGYMAHLKKELANLPAELVKNGLEVPDSTTIKVWLDETMLTVENDGSPIGSVDDFQKYILTCFETSKSEQNYGKGFTAILMEEETDVYTGCIHATIRAWNDITIRTDSEFQQGMRVVVHLKPDSQVLMEGSAKLFLHLSDYITRKTIIFNDRPVELEELSGSFEPFLRDWSKSILYYDTSILGSIDSFGHYFMLSTGDLAPIQLDNVPRFVGVIISDVKHVDTERTKLVHASRHYLERWADTKLQDKYKEQNVTAEVVAWLREWADWCEEFVYKISGERFSFFRNDDGVKMGDLRVLEKWIEYLNKVSNQAKMKPFTTPRPEMDENHEEMVKISKSGMVTDYLMREIGEWFFNPILHHPFGRIKIGVCVIGGEVDRNGFIDDVVLYKMIHTIDSGVFWENVNERFPPVVAYYVDPGPIIYADTLDVRTVMKETESKVSIERPPEDKKIEAPKEKKVELIAEKASPEQMKTAIKTMCRNRKSKMDEEDEYENPIGKPVEGRPDYTFVEHKGIWCIVHHSVTDLEKVKFTRSVQMEKWKAWTNTISLILQYTGDFFCEACVPVLFISKKNTALARHVGPYVALNRVKTSLPDTKYRRAIYLLSLAIHELTHFRVKNHGTAFTQISEDMFLELVKHPTFLSELVKVI